MNGKFKKFSAAIIDEIMLLKKEEYNVNLYMKSTMICFNKNILVEDEEGIYEAVIYNNKNGLAIYNVETKQLKNV